MTKEFLERRKKNPIKDAIGLESSNPGPIRDNAQITMIHRDNVWHPYYEIKVEEDDIGTRFKKNQDAKKEKDIDGAGVAAAMEQITNFDKAQKDQQEALESAQGPKKRIFDMNKIRQQKMQESAAGGAQDNKVQDYMSVRMSDIPGAMTEQDLK